MQIYFQAPQLSKKRTLNSSPTATSVSLPTIKMEFDLPLYPRQIPQWRGAINEQVQNRLDLLHNHTSNGKVLYRYPLVQFRTKKGKAQLWGMGAGTDALRDWLSHSNQEFSLGGRKQRLCIVGLQAQDYELRVLPELRTYRLLDYLPFNSVNYQRWQQLHTLTERIALLERILVGHIFAFCSAANWQVPDRLEVNLLDIQERRTEKVHGHLCMAFNLLLRTNVQLPPNIALGKAVAFGFGVIRPLRYER